MKKTDAHAFLTQICSDHFAKLEPACKMAMKDPMEQALKALAPVTEGAAVVGDPPGATNG